MRVELQSAYILHSRAYSESSLLVDLLTLDYGLISGVIKGGRRKSKTKVPAQLFTPLIVSWMGKTDLKSIIHVEPAAPMLALPGTYLFAGLYINEILERLLQPGLPQPEIYGAYESVLSSLAQGGDMEATLRHFEFCLLDDLGYGFDWWQAADTGLPIDPEHFYRFDPRDGFLTVAVKTGNGIFSGQDILQIAGGDYPTALARQSAKKIARMALAPHLGSKPIKSRELFRSYIS